MLKEINDAFIGNDRIRVGLNRKGKVLRLYYPNPDYKQFFEFCDTLFKVNDRVFNIHEDLGNKYTQEYVKDTNILKTEIFNLDHGVKIEQVDFVCLNEDVFVREYKITNLTKEDKNITPIVHSKAVSNFNNEVSGYVRENSLCQYNHDYSSTIFSKLDMYKFKVNNNNQNMDIENFNDSDYIGLSNTSTISFKPFNLKAEKSKTFEILIHLNDNKKVQVSNQLETEIIRLRKIDYKAKQKETKKYWNKYVKDHTKHDLKNVSDEAKKIYSRSILLFPLMYNSQTGGLSAAFEVDEHKSLSGRYSFSWPRDTFFASYGYDLVGFTKEFTKYYTDFLRTTQNRDGRWEQRFYTDGTLAPSWGYQIDETAAVIIGAFNHYKIIKDRSFLKDIIIMLERAAKYLYSYATEIISGKDTNSFDIWETHKGESSYGVAAVFGAFEAMLGIYRAVEPLYAKNRLKIEQINKQRKYIENILPKLKIYIEETFYNLERSSLVRGKYDNSIDISSLMVSAMFNVFTPKEHKITRTREKIDEILKTHTGGYIRFEGDDYLNGTNPWPMTNLILCLLNIENAEYDKALENFNFATKTASKHGFLAEQISNETMKPEWVVGLSWMHGLYIYVLDKLIKKDILHK